MRVEEFGQKKDMENKEMRSRRKINHRGEKIGGIEEKRRAY